MPQSFRIKKRGKYKTRGELFRKLNSVRICPKGYRVDKIVDGKIYLKRIRDDIQLNKEKKKMILNKN